MNEIMTAKPEAVGLSSSRLGRVERWMRRQIEIGRLTGLEVMVNRKGRTAFHHCEGLADVARGRPATKDTIHRFYSMTKPLTSVAIMMLYEEGLFQLDDPISRFVPAFAGQRVFVNGGRGGALHTEPVRREVTFRDLLTHTSGLTYGFMNAHPVDAMYLAAGLDLKSNALPLGAFVEKLAGMPLIAHPGEAWNYSMATDVLGHLVAVLSGQPFDAFLRERVTGPLGMTDTDFHVSDDKIDRFSACYLRGPGDKPVLEDDPATSRYRKPPTAPSGGGGLVSTARDYMRFCQMMLGRGALGNVRLLGRKTVELMTLNHLNGDMAAMGQARFSESNYHGIGFGLGFSVMLDPAKAQIAGSAGEYAWGGMASTAFWIDPQEDMAVILTTQLIPSSSYPIRRELRALTYQALVD